MYTFIFCFTDSSKHYFEHIKSASYVRSETIKISENELLSHDFPIGRDLHLFSDTSNYTVSGANLMWIEVSKES